MMKGLRASRCKALLALPGGEHREVMLPEGEHGFGLDGTRCYMNLEAAAPELRALLRPEGVPPRAVDRVNAYVSRARSGTPLHFDVRSVWIVQLVGTKAWVVSRTAAVQNPHRNCVAPPDSTSADYDGATLRVPTEPAELLVTRLCPGDWLYVPKAAWHTTFTHQGSISATLAAPEGFEEGAEGASPLIAPRTSRLHRADMRLLEGR
jgi:hypothetical protein